MWNWQRKVERKRAKFYWAFMISVLHKMLSHSMFVTTSSTNDGINTNFVQILYNGIIYKFYGWRNWESRTLKQLAKLMHWVNGNQDANLLVFFPCEWSRPLSCPCHKHGCIPRLTTNWLPHLVDFDPLIALSTIYFFPVFASIRGQFFSGILQQLHSCVPCLKLIHSTHGSNQACHQFL